MPAWGDMIVARVSLLASAALREAIRRWRSWKPRCIRLAAALQLHVLSRLRRDNWVRADARGRAAAATWRRDGAVSGRLRDGGRLVKHGLLGLPPAVPIWLALMRRRVATVWLIAAVGSLAAGLLITAVLHGHATLADVPTHRRSFRAARVIPALQRLIRLAPMMLSSGPAYRRRATGDRRPAAAVRRPVRGDVAGRRRRAAPGRRRVLERPSRR